MTHGRTLVCDLVLDKRVCSRCQVPYEKRYVYTFVSALVTAELLWMDCGSVSIQQRSQIPDSKLGSMKGA